MSFDRREFNLGLIASMVGTAGLSGRLLASDDGVSPADSSNGPHFFKHPTFEYVFLISLGRAYQMAGNVGKVLYIGRQIKDGDFESAYLAFRQAGDEARGMAEDSAKRGHRESARQAYLWAQNFYDSSTYFLDGSKDPTRFSTVWEIVYDCWSKSIALFDPPIIPVGIPYEGTELRGFYFRSASSARKRPLLILVNGSDGSLLDMWTQGGASALARGYDCLTFDGPGQGYALWKQKLYFRPDWEKVVSPVVDFALSRKEVDPNRIAIQGISQGGYWVPRAVAFEKRIAAAIADPGVIDVSTSWTAKLPPPMRELLKAGRKPEFDEVMSKNINPAAAAALRFRMRPYGLASYYDVFTAVSAYNLRDIAGQIRCPVLITAPTKEEFWPGQSQQLYSLVQSPKLLVEFTEAEGAALHCEPEGLGLRDLRVFNWLDETLQR